MVGKHHIATVGVFLLASIASSGAATGAPVCDLRTGLPANYPICSIGQGLFAPDEQLPTGTGFIESFLRIQEAGTKTMGGTVYRDFFLGADETAATNKGRSFITLDQFEIYASNTPSLNSEVRRGNTRAMGALTGATKVYDMDTASDNDIQLNYNLSGRGSGSSHAVFYLPGSLFGNSQYVYLYSQFGNLDGSDGRRASDSGPEDWFSNPRPSRPQAPD